MRKVTYTRKFSGEPPSICKHEWRLMGERMEKYFLFSIDAIPILKNRWIMCYKCGWETTAIKCKVIGNKKWPSTKECDKCLDIPWYDVIVDVIEYKDLPPTKLMDYSIETTKLNWWKRFKQRFYDMWVRKNEVTHKDVTKRIANLL